MVKIPIGQKVEINLWDEKKKRGMAKYYHDTMDIVRAESEFDLKKGDMAIVVESYDSFCVLVPEDEYTDLIDNYSTEKVNMEGLTNLIWSLLQERQQETGGILSFEELFSIFKRTSIQSIITPKTLKQVWNQKNASFDKMKFNGTQYFALKAQDMVYDKQRLLDLVRALPFLTVDLVQKEFPWTDVRIQRMLDFLVEEGRVHKESTYRTGTRYYFIQSQEN